MQTFLHVQKSQLISDLDIEGFIRLIENKFII